MVFPTRWDRDYIDGDALKRGEYIVRDIPSLLSVLPVSEEQDKFFREVIKARAQNALEKLKDELSNDPNYPFTKKQPIIRVIKK